MAVASELLLAQALLKVYQQCWVEEEDRSRQKDQLQAVVPLEEEAEPSAMKQSVSVRPIFLSWLSLARYLMVHRHLLRVWMGQA